MIRTNSYNNPHTPRTKIKNLRAKKYNALVRHPCRRWTSEERAGRPNASRRQTQHRITQSFNSRDQIRNSKWQLKTGGKI
jgi:hypothetical protein